MTRHEHAPGKRGQSSSAELRLRPLRLDDEAAFRSAHQVTAAEDFGFGISFEPAMEWNSYLETLEPSLKDAAAGWIL